MQPNTLASPSMEGDVTFLNNLKEYIEGDLRLFGGDLSPPLVAKMTQLVAELEVSAGLAETIAGVLRDKDRLVPDVDDEDDGCPVFAMTSAHNSHFVRLIYASGLEQARSYNDMGVYAKELDTGPVKMVIEARLRPGIDAWEIEELDLEKDVIEWY